MYIVHVDIHVKLEFLDAFKAATIDNASNSIREAGIARFDFIQRSDDPTRFMLVEVYRTPADADLHKQTAHYARWRDTVTHMMAEPRTRHEYSNILPDDQGWG
jgi:quinol monooxygenase YgiN